MLIEVRAKKFWGVVLVFGLGAFIVFQLTVGNRQKFLVAFGGDYLKIN